MTRLLTVRVDRDEDVVVARQRARQVADTLGFETQDQTRIATAVSEIARNVARYAGKGTVTFSLNLEAGTLSIVVADDGPGIPHLDAVLSGRYRSATGMGLGLTGARRIMDVFAIRSTPGQGTVVTMEKRVPRRPGASVRVDVGAISDRLARMLAARKLRW